MKSSCICLLFLASAGSWAVAQAPVIHSLSENGMLICENLEPGTTAAVEWAPSVEGPWNQTWEGLGSIPVPADGRIRTGVPMFFRVRGVPVSPDRVQLSWVNPGTFLRGSPDKEPERQADEVQAEVTVTRGFWICKHEVTQEEFLEVMGWNPSFFKGVRDHPRAATDHGFDPLRPVEQVSWHDAVNYCAGLTERERSAGRLPEGYAYRLPTETEWEYACRAGTSTAFHYGASLRAGMANFDGRFEYAAHDGTVQNPDGMNLGQPTKRGSYEPNAWQIYDMHGNVWEWCQDWYGAYVLRGGGETDPTGPLQGPGRVVRGGSYTDGSERFGGATYCRSAVRHWLHPDYGYPHVGFRVVLAPLP